MTDGDFSSEGSILVEMSSGFMSAAGVDKVFKTADWLLIGWLAARDQCKHIFAPPKICRALEIAESLLMYKSNILQTKRCNV